MRCARRSKRPSPARPLERHPRHLMLLAVVFPCRDDGPERFQVGDAERSGPREISGDGDGRSFARGGDGGKGNGQQHGYALRVPHHALRGTIRTLGAFTTALASRPGVSCSLSALARVTSATRRTPPSTVIRTSGPSSRRAATAPGRRFSAEIGCRVLAPEFAVRRFDDAVGAA